MKTIEIFYHQLEAGLPHDYDEVIKTSLSLPGVGFEPTSVFENSDKNSIYYQCPAWSHKAKRTFIIRSPVDLNIFVNLEEQSLWVDNINQDQFNSWFRFENGWCRKEKITIQLMIPHLLFWTKQQNIWVEQKPFFETCVKNNFTTLNGWFNLSAWTRPMSFAFDVIDTSKPIIIKRGDPIYTVSFYSKNLNANIKLTKKCIDFETHTKMRKNLSVKQITSYLSSKLIFQEQESKCPFAFLWKKTP